MEVAKMKFVAIVNNFGNEDIDFFLVDTDNPETFEELTNLHTISIIEFEEFKRKVMEVINDGV